MGRFRARRPNPADGDLHATLRHAEREMSAGRGSRLSQILQHTKEIKSKGRIFTNHTTNPMPDPKTLSVLGLGDYANYLLGESEGIKTTRDKLHNDYLTRYHLAMILWMPAFP